MMSALTASAARAQQPNLNYLGGQSGVTIASSSILGRVAYQAGPASLATTQSGRQSCWIEYLGAEILAVPTTPQSLGLVFFGPTAPTVTSTSFALVPYQFLNCEQAVEVEGNAVWVASTATGAFFVFKVK